MDLYSKIINGFKVFMFSKDRRSEFNEYMSIVILKYFFFEIVLAY